MIVRVARLSGIIDTAEIDSAVSLIPRRLTQRYYKHTIRINKFSNLKKVSLYQ